MNEHFIKIFETSEELKQVIEQREKLCEERKQIIQETRLLFNKVIAKYQEERKKIDDLQAKAEKENQEKQKTIIVLTKQLITSGENKSVTTQELEKLKGDVATYPLQIEAYEQLKKEICVPCDDIDKLNLYKEKGREIGQQIYNKTATICRLLAELKSISDSCVTIFDMTLEYRGINILPDLFQKLDDMQKEDKAGWRKGEF